MPLKPEELPGRDEWPGRDIVKGARSLARYIGCCEVTFRSRMKEMGHPLQQFVRVTEKGVYFAWRADLMEYLRGLPTVAQARQQARDKDSACRPEGDL